MNHFLQPKHAFVIGSLWAALTVGSMPWAVAAPPPQPSTATPLTEHGERLQARYAGMLEGIQAEIAQATPVVAEQHKVAAREAEAAVKKAEEVANAAQQELGKIQTAKALVDHAKGKWIGGAEKGIAQAEAALKAATTQAAREAANQELAKWQANKQDGLKALKERQAALDQAKIDEPKWTQASQAAQAALAKARANELMAAQALLTELQPFISSDKLDAKLVLGVVLASATPRGLAEFAQRGPQQEALVEKLLGDSGLMRQMLAAGGANLHKYGRAMEIYTAIQQASPKSRDGALQRLALGVSLEHALPIVQSNPKDQAAAPTSVDPVQRYLHYERAFADGELDPAFSEFSVWEYRMVVDSDASDEILAWGREMLRNFRPDHIFNPDLGWRYSGLVRTDVSYGSQNVHCDLASLHNYQNIIRNGGVCGRRAFFGRFILKSFGIPTWGVTQHKHAAVSHWTPKGWVVNLGAGFQHSWWDKDEAPRSGQDFLLETQAREHEQDYLRVLRAQWVSRILGEPAYNDRKKVAGGFWSSLAHKQAVALASTEVTLGPLGQNLAEANESPASKAEAVAKASVSEADKKIALGSQGEITIPAGACSGAQVMKSFQGGQQLFCGAGSGAFSCQVDVPQAGAYALTARVVTVHDEQRLQLSTTSAQKPVELAIPYTCGAWQKTQPVVVALERGKNVLSFSKPANSFALKDLILTPVK